MPWHKLATSFTPVNAVSRKPYRGVNVLTLWATAAEHGYSSGIWATYAAGRRVTRTGDQMDPESMEALASPRCASVGGFSLHANTAVPAGDRTRLERLCRYCGRPPIAIERLEPLSDGRLAYRFKRPWRDGTSHVVFAPLQFLEKLSAIVPAPKTHLVRYSGILGPAAKWRPLILPTSLCDFQHNVAKAATLWFNRLRSIYGLRIGWQVQRTA